MMEKISFWTEMTANQRRLSVDAAQLHLAYGEASGEYRAYRGGMHWKKASGQEYLFRSRDRRGYGKSLGARSAQTEAVYSDFHENKKRLAERLRHLREQLKEQARFCKAARVARVPRVVCAILRLLEQKKLLGSTLQVIGTNALYAYEAQAGVLFQSALMATRDADMLWDVRSKLQLETAAPLARGGFLALLQQAGRSFELIRKRGFRAVCRLVLEHMPHLRFTPSELRMFPKSVVAAAAAALEKGELPPGYDL